VTLACRRGRFVLQKVVAGVPADWQWFTRFGALLGRALPPEALAAGLREQLLAVAGDPARYGAPAPDEDLLATGLSQGQHYLALVAEGRIAPRPEVVAVEGDVVSFADGSRAAFDAIVCATGYELDLPYLDGDVRAVLGVEGPYVDLYQRTLHPDLPGLGVMGQFVLQGPYFPVLELQARWLAGVWSGAIDAPSQEQMRAGIERYRELRPMMRFDLFHALVTGLAEEIGVAPDLTARPALTEALLFGPLAPAQFRLDGPGALPEAEGLLVRAVSEFGGEVAIDAEQVAGLRMVAETLDDDALREAAATVAGDGVAVAA
jgi:dimethylaniline monooxygenase (N-oxide forming)